MPLMKPLRVMRSSNIVLSFTAIAFHFYDSQCNRVVTNREERITAAELNSYFEEGGIANIPGRVTPSCNILVDTEVSAGSVPVSERDLSRIKDRIQDTLEEKGYTVIRAQDFDHMVAPQRVKFDITRLSKGLFDRNRWEIRAKMEELLIHGTQWLPVATVRNIKKQRTAKASVTEVLSYLPTCKISL
jgi:hypothetical protein